MAVSLHVLASGSSGNCSLLDLDGSGVLIDLGLGPRQLAGRIGDGPPLWDRVRAALLTHVHTDHWNETTLNHLVRRRVPLYCHGEHAASLRESSPAFAALDDAGLVCPYAMGTPFVLDRGCRCTPIALRHDGGPTFGFRLEGPRDIFGCDWALAYLADLGSWDRGLARRIADVDVLALEFNHDVAMQYQSGRSPDLIRRVLGDHGHLSNVQAAALLAEVLAQSVPGRLRHLVQLHLSRQCNRPKLARDAADAVVRQAAAPIWIHTARQQAAVPPIAFDQAPVPIRYGGRSAKKRVYQVPTLFADWE
jgi:hypothetical protein